MSKFRRVMTISVHWGGVAIGHATLTFGRCLYNNQRFYDQMNNTVALSVSNRSDTHLLGILIVVGRDVRGVKRGGGICDIEDILPDCATNNNRIIKWMAWLNSVYRIGRKTPLQGILIVVGRHTKRG